MLKLSIYFLIGTALAAPVTVPEKRQLSGLGSAGGSSTDSGLGAIESALSGILGGGSGLGALGEGTGTSSGLGSLTSELPTVGGTDNTDLPTVTEKRQLSGLGSLGSLGGSGAASGLGSLTSSIPGLGSLGGGSGLGSLGGGSGLGSLGGSGLGSLGGSGLGSLGSLGGASGLGSLGSLGGASGLSGILTRARERLSRRQLSGLGSLGGSGLGSLGGSGLGSLGGSTTSSGLGALESELSGITGSGGLGSLGSGSGLGSLGSGSGLGSLGGSSTSSGLGSLTSEIPGLSGAGDAIRREELEKMAAPADKRQFDLGSLLGGTSSTTGSTGLLSGDTENGVTSNSGCTGTTVIFARGTSESGNVGTIAGPPMFAKLRSTLGDDKVTIQGVNYPASIAGNAELGASGGPEMVTLVEQAQKQCPDSKIVLSGYSQGAMVVHYAASRVKGMSGAVVFGDPLSTESVSGIAAANVFEVCASGDTLCGGVAKNSQSGTGHLSYGSDATQAAAFIVKVAS